MASSEPELEPAISALLSAAASHRASIAAPELQWPTKTLMGALFKTSAFGGHESRVAFASADESVVSALLQTPTAGARGTLVYLHGGGWAMGSSEEYRHFTATLAERLRVAVLSVDYRLAPHHPFPAALHDAMGALRFAARLPSAALGSRAHLVCMGDSAGAALATIAARIYNCAAPVRPVSLQVLAYPVCDHRLQTPSHRRYGAGYLLTTEDMRRFWDQYCPDPAAREREDCSPLAATDLRGSPQALLVTAGLDPLQDEGQEYAVRLRSAGIPVDALHFDGLPHGFLALEQRSEAARAALSTLVQRVDEKLADKRNQTAGAS